MKWILNRLKEKSTITALVGLLVWAGAMFGMELDADAQLQLTTVVGGILALVMAVLKEKDSE
jgi:uncharacterized membrane protein